MKPEDYRFRNYKWKNNKLYLGNEKTGYSVVEEKGHPGMFSVQWPDGILSGDFYNITRAKDHGIKVAIEDIRNGYAHTDMGGGPGALKKKMGTWVAK